MNISELNLAIHDVEMDLYFKRQKIVSKLIDQKYSEAIVAMNEFIATYNCFTNLHEQLNKINNPLNP